MRHLPVVALVPLIGLATYLTIGAIALVPDRGDDFQRLYVSAVNWAHGGDPYAIEIADTPNLNHPLLLPVFWLFTLGSVRAGFIAWSITSLVAMAACLPAISVRARIAPLDLAMLILASSGTFLALVFGQVSLFLMVLFTAAWCADRRGDTIPAAVMLGLLSVLKPFFGLFGLFFLLRRAWRALAVYGSVFVVGNAIGWALIGTPRFLEWVARLRDIQWRWHIYNASAWGVGDRLFTVQPFFRATQWTPLTESPLLAHLVTAAILAVVIVVLLVRVSASDLDRSYSLLGLGSLLISPLGWLYYLPAFAGPVITTIGRRPSRSLWPMVVLAIFPSLLLVSRSYGKVGTLAVGQWAFVIVSGLFGLAAASEGSTTREI